MSNTLRKDNNFYVDQIFSKTKSKIDSLEKEDNVVKIKPSLSQVNNTPLIKEKEQEIQQVEIIIKPAKEVNNNNQYLTKKQAPVKPNPLRWVKNMIIGAGHTYYERLSMFINPISFILKNISLISTGVFYVCLPALLSFYFLYAFPVYRANLMTGGFSQLVSMLGLYMGFAFLSTLALLFIRTLSLGIVRMLNNFALKGQKISQK